MIFVAAIVVVVMATATAAEDRQSGYAIMSPELQAMQDDEARHGREAASPVDALSIT